MSGHHNHKKGYEFVCVDEDTEYVPGTRGSKYGALFYPVGYRRTLWRTPCYPYIAGREPTCAVCTKGPKNAVALEVQKKIKTEKKVVTCDFFCSPDLT